MELEQYDLPLARRQCGKRVADRGASLGLLEIIAAVALSAGLERQLVRGLPAPPAQLVEGCVARDCEQQRTRGPAPAIQARARAYSRSKASAVTSSAAAGSSSIETAYP